MDTLQEAYINKNTKERIAKIDFETCLHEDCVEEFKETNNPGSYLFFKGRGDTLYISYEKEDYPTFGITGLLNVGNVDQNQGDELALITGWADYSLVTMCEIWTFHLRKWEKLTEFCVHEGRIYDSSIGKTVLMRNDRNDKSPNAKGIFFMENDNVFYYEYDFVDGRILEKKLKIE